MNEWMKRCQSKWIYYCYLYKNIPFVSTYSQENYQGGIHKKTCKTDKNENLTEQQIKEKCVFTAHLD